MVITRRARDRSFARSHLALWISALFLATILAIAVLAQSAQAVSNSGTGHHCVVGWNNADWEKDFFWAATGEYKGDWYNIYGYGRCWKVNVQIRAFGSWCLDSRYVPGPGGITVQKTEYDGYVTTSKYITPSNRYYPSSVHRGWPQYELGLVDTRVLCFKGGF